MTASKLSAPAICTILFWTLASISLFAQSKEVIQELSKAARKGVIADAKIADNGQLRLTYKMKVDKKSDEVLYEDYVFTKDLEYKGIEPSTVSKLMKPDEKRSSVVAYVGGTNSFNVLSMNVTLRRAEFELKWNMERQRYEWGKQLSSEVVKPGNSDNKYKGFAAFDDREDGSVLVLAGYDKGKSDENEFLFLHVNGQLNLTETKLPLNGSYSLVYTGSLKSGNVFAIFSPNKGMPQLNKYCYVEVTRKGAMVIKKEFDAPANATVFMDFAEIDGILIFAAVSDKSNDAFNQQFTDYAPIQNPGYTASANYQMFKYEKSVYGKSFENFHLLRFANGELNFSSYTPVKEFKAKLVTPPSQKKATPYEGSRIDIQRIQVTQAGEYLVAGQLQDRKVTSSSFNYLYGDYVCFHFDATGKLKAQYAVEKMMDDSKDQLFPSEQTFVPSSDGKNYFWEIMEVKSTKYYGSFAEAYSGISSVRGHYLPRITKIDMNNSKLSDATTLGDKGKYLVYNNPAKVIPEGGKPIIVYYIGHDEDYEKIWIGKYRFE